MTFLHLYNQSLVFVNLGEANPSAALWYYRTIIACRKRGEVNILTRGDQSRSAGPFSSHSFYEVHSDIKS